MRHIELIVILLGLVFLTGYITFGPSYLMESHLLSSLSKDVISICYLSILIGYSSTLAVTIHDRIFRCE